jgi:hypothetical protein
MARLKDVGQILVGLILVFCFVKQIQAYTLEGDRAHFPLSSSFVEHPISIMELAFMGMDYPLTEAVLQEALGMKSPVETYLDRAFYGTIIFKVPTNEDPEAMRLRIGRILKGKGIKGEVFKLHEKGIVVQGIGP